MSQEVKLESGWRDQLKDEFDQDYMKSLRQFLATEAKRGKIIYPHGDEIFAALNFTPFDQVKAVILGQDPYHGPGQAHGLCFSVKEGITPPPSLVNIYKELATDLGLSPSPHGCLSQWAKQGVLLLNSVLTVERGRAASHQGRGWERFTDRIIECLSSQREGLVFVLWGSYAQKKGQSIDRTRHLVLSSPHPSPLSAYRGFFGSKPFSQTNNYLASRGKALIDWSTTQASRTSGSNAV